jgi:hypothetical protein
MVALGVTRDAFALRYGSRPPRSTRRGERRRFAGRRATRPARRKNRPRQPSSWAMNFRRRCRQPARAEPRHLPTVPREGRRSSSLRPGTDFASWSTTRRRSASLPILRPFDHRMPLPTRMPLTSSIAFTARGSGGISMPKPQPYKGFFARPFIRAHLFRFQHTGCPILHVIMPHNGVIS